MTAMLLAPDFPVRRAPPMIGTGNPFSDRPMRRLKNRSVCTGADVNEAPVPIVKRFEFSRKKSRFSGKKSPKRVRFTCCSSTSTCAKSVLTVTSRLSPAVTP
jgi:hypothetical protein